MGLSLHFYTFAVGIFELRFKTQEIRLLDIYN